MDRLRRVLAIRRVAVGTAEEFTGTLEGAR